MQLQKHTKIHTQIPTDISDANLLEALLKYPLPQAT